jgi:hypothetical protein
VRDQRDVALQLGRRLVGREDAPVFHG